MTSNQAAYIIEKQGKIEVRDAPLGEPEENEVLVQVKAVAVNPVDWKIQSHGFFLEKFPNILGCDFAGIVIKTGSSVDSIKVDDRVMAHSWSLMTGNQAQAAYQHYAIGKLPLVAKIPDNMEFEEAVVLPLGFDTAAAGLFEKDKLAMTMPPSSDGKGKVLFVWGGSSSVGSCAIQLASAAGYEVVTTASKRNHDYCQNLGASKVYDYNDKSIIDDAAAALKGKEIVGAIDTISYADTVKSCIDILTKAGGRKMVATVLPGTDQHAKDGAEVKPVFGLTPGTNEVGKLWSDYLPKALREGSFKAMPPPVSAGKGLESVQKGMDMNKEGVSGKKVVITF